MIDFLLLLLLCAQNSFAYFTLIREHTFLLLLIILNSTENKIEIKYETIEESPNDHNNIQNGEFILNKIDELSENDNEKFKSVYGLLRYEFFDILLRLSQLKFDEFGTHNFKYQSFLKLIQDYIIPFIWDDINSVNTSKDSYQWLFKKDSKSLQKLFKMYSKQNRPNMVKKWEGLLEERLKIKDE